MEFIKEIIKNRNMILKLGKNDFKNKFANTSLGSIWGFLQPFIYMITYAIVLQFILKAGNSGEDPFIVWYLPGMAMWLFLNDSVNNITESIRNYSYLVKKVVFPVDIIPVISLVSNSIISIFVILIATFVCAINGYFPNILLLIYYIFAALCFIISFTRLTSAISTLIADFGKFLSILMQLLFWFTPIIWNISMIDGMLGGKIAILVKCMPFSYLITGFRQVFIQGNILTELNGIYTIIFWIITILIFIWGNNIFKKAKKDFPDVL